ncbi:hypothetical protein HAX54_034746, partial [Datura stramonium]|nr:hypothetical protein [Datura stramonium]
LPHLSELDTNREDWPARVRVCRMWEFVNFKRNRELISLDLILMDEKETLMHVVIWKNQVNKFRDKLSEGSMIIIPNFKVTDCTGEYRPVSREVTFATTAARKIYVNLKIGCITSLIQRFANTSVGVQTIVSNNANNISIEEEILQNRMIISELLDSDWSIDIQECTFTLWAQITEIDNYFDWHYISCNSFHKKIIPTKGVYTCHTYTRECEFPLVRYKIHVKVKDAHGQTTLVLFNVVAEKLLDTFAFKLVNRLSSVNSDVPLQIQSLCGKEFVFKLKLNNFNLKDELEIVILMSTTLKAKIQTGVPIFKLIP